MQTMHTDEDTNTNRGQVKPRACQPSASPCARTHTHTTHRLPLYIYIHSIRQPHRRDFVPSGRSARSLFRCSFFRALRAAKQGLSIHFCSWWLVAQLEEVIGDQRVDSFFGPAGGSGGPCVPHAQSFQLAHRAARRLRPLGSPKGFINLSTRALLSKRPLRSYSAR